ncbi:MAG TPA: hypothetical protein VEU53_08045 [Stellaceae bacterium]|nr:hypothetical protein [Stellaceae bacterium]
MTRTLYRKVLEQRLSDIAQQLDKLGRKLKAANGMDRLRYLEAMIALKQERGDAEARLRPLDRGGVERRRDAIRFELERLADDITHGMARWMARLDGHFAAR